MIRYDKVRRLLILLLCFSQIKSDKMSKKLTKRECGMFKSHACWPGMIMTTFGMTSDDRDAFVKKHNDCKVELMQGKDGRIPDEKKFFCLLHKGDKNCPSWQAEDQVEFFGFKNKMFAKHREGGIVQGVRTEVIEEQINECVAKAITMRRLGKTLLQMNDEQEEEAGTETIEDWDPTSEQMKINLNASHLEVGEFDENNEEESSELKEELRKTRVQFEQERIAKEKAAQKSLKMEQENISNQQKISEQVEAMNKLKREKEILMEETAAAKSKADELLKKNGELSSSTGAGTDKLKENSGLVSNMTTLTLDLTDTFVSSPTADETKNICRFAIRHNRASIRMFAMDKKWNFSALLDDMHEFVPFYDKSAHDTLWKWTQHDVVTYFKKKPSIPLIQKAVLVADKFNEDPRVKEKVENVINTTLLPYFDIEKELLDIREDLFDGRYSEDSFEIFDGTTMMVGERLSWLEKRAFTQRGFDYELMFEICQELRPKDLENLEVEMSWSPREMTTITSGFEKFIMGARMKQKLEVGTRLDGVLTPKLLQNIIKSFLKHLRKDGSSAAKYICSEIEKHSAFDIMWLPVDRFRRSDSTVILSNLQLALEDIHQKSIHFAKETENGMEIEIVPRDKISKPGNANPQNLAKSTRERTRHSNRANRQRWDGLNKRFKQYRNKQQTVTKEIMATLATTLEQVLNICTDKYEDSDFIEMFESGRVHWVCNTMIEGDVYSIEEASEKLNGGESYYYHIHRMGQLMMLDMSVLNANMKKFQDPKIRGLLDTGASINLVRRDVVMELDLVDLIKQDGHGIDVSSLGHRQPLTSWIELDIAIGQMELGKHKFWIIKKEAMGLKSEIEAIIGQPILRMAGYMQYTQQWWKEAAGVET